MVKYYFLIVLKKWRKTSPHNTGKEMRAGWYARFHSAALCGGVGPFWAPRGPLVTWEEGDIQEESPWSFLFIFTTVHVPWKITWDVFLKKDSSSCLQRNHWDVLDLWASVYKMWKVIAFYREERIAHRPYIHKDPTIILGTPQILI